MKDLHVMQVALLDRPKDRNQPIPHSKNMARSFPNSQRISVSIPAADKS